MSADTQENKCRYIYQTLTLWYIYQELQNLGKNVWPPPVFIIKCLATSRIIILGKTGFLAEFQVDKGAQAIKHGRNPGRRLSNRLTGINITAISQTNLWQLLQDNAGINSNWQIMLGKRKTWHTCLVNSNGQSCRK
jgi:hypothetical protein